MSGEQITLSESAERGVWTVQGTRVEDTSLLLECLYNINKHAKKYAELGTENYQAGKKATAKVNSVKKDALYTLKERVLAEIYEYAADVGLHVIHDDLFYFVDFESYSFHTPVGTLSIPQSQTGDPVELDEFTSTAEKEHSNKSLKACLQYFNQEFGLNTNQYLSREYVSYGRNSHFTGWAYLNETETDT